MKIYSYESPCSQAAQGKHGESTNGILISNFILPANSKIESDNLPLGVLIIEAKKEDNAVIERKLIIVIKQ